MLNRNIDLKGLVPWVTCSVHEGVSFEFELSGRNVLSAHVDGQVLRVLVYSFDNAFFACFPCVVEFDIDVARSARNVWTCEEVEGWLVVIAKDDGKFLWEVEFFGKVAEGDQFLDGICPYDVFCFVWTSSYNACLGSAVEVEGSIIFAYSKSISSLAASRVVGSISSICSHFYLCSSSGVESESEIRGVLEVAEGLDDLVGITFGGIGCVGGMKAHFFANVDADREGEYESTDKALVLLLVEGSWIRCDGKQVRSRGYGG